MVWSEYDGGVTVSPRRRLSAELLSAVEEPNCVGWSLAGRFGVSAMPVRSGRIQIQKRGTNGPPRGGIVLAGGICTEYNDWKGLRRFFGWIEPARAPRLRHSLAAIAVKERRRALARRRKDGLSYFAG